MGVHMFEVALIAVTVTVAAAVLVLSLRVFRDQLRWARGRRVIVQLDEATVVGVLKKSGPVFLTLSDATAGLQDPRPLDGTLAIRVARVQYVQVVG